jgi:hypothetical protein
MRERQPWLGLLRRRECLVPTGRGCLLLLLLFGLVLGSLGLGIYPFLAVHDPVRSGILVVEGWQPDYAMELAIAEFRRHPYSKLYVTGGPLEKGGPLSQYETIAEMGRATILRLGLPTNAVQAVPALAVRKDRTYASAVALKTWLSEHQVPLTSCHIMTFGPHARRTRLMYEKAFGSQVRIGVTALPNRDYEAKQWWRYSEGVREVISEAIAYLYARLLFHPGKA